MTARLSLHHKAEAEIYKLERSVKGAFYDFCHDFRNNPDHPGLDLKPLKGNRDIFRAKVNSSFRALLVRAGVDASGTQSWLVIAVRDRKNVYEELTVAVNRVTGEIEFVDLAVVGDSVLRRAGVTLTPTEPETVETPTQHVPPAEPVVPLLAGVTADELRGLGVAEPLVELALTVADSTELDQLVADAPLLSKDVLYGIAAGMSVEEVRTEITAPVAVELADATDLTAAMARTTVMTVDDDIRAVIEGGDFGAWKIFLHPTQSTLVKRRYNGPARVSGGPGTGKTIVALYRVKHLVEQLEPGSTKPILLTTFTKNLTTDLRARLSLLLEPDQLARVDIAHIDQLAARVLSENGGPGSRRRRIDDVQALGILRQVLAEIGDQRWTAEFLLEEWDQVVLGQSLGSRKDYFDARRAGRGRSLTRPERNQVWKLLEQLTARLDRDGVETWGQASERAARYEAARAAMITENGEHNGESSGTRYRRHRYLHVVVDEAQDLSAAHWTMLRAMVPPSPDDMFITGDTHQRIYDNRVTLGTVGIHIRGRSSRLTLSYRTTREILARAIGIVAPGTVAYDDLDDGTDTLNGYRSVLRGPAPELVGYESWSDELDALVAVIAAWREDIATGGDQVRRDPRGNIAICVAERDKVTEVAGRLTAHGITSAELTKEGPQGDGDIHIGTMHRFKGLEYQRLAIVGASAGVIPRAAAIERFRVEDPQLYLREERKARSLLFVAATRARDTLRISWHGKRSPYLSGLTGMNRALR
ncbi:UvrD-helicase domain-containing protein [Pseudonocardia sp. GCM10023141]|uniref:UvrD-helicase domain-containing protein n=1 Tax=Pseudonocardia sp. GCM10023141 TaxID=3252653 RepID=UPI003615C569